MKWRRMKEQEQYNIERWLESPSGQVISIVDVGVPFESQIRYLSPKLGRVTIQGSKELLAKKTDLEVIQNVGKILQRDMPAPAVQKELGIPFTRPITSLLAAKKAYESKKRSYAPTAKQTGFRKSISRDLQRKAKSAGWRTSSTGKRYYEARRNRSDVRTKRGWL